MSSSPRRALFALARPRGVWLPALLPLLGYGWAHWDRALIAWRPLALVPLLLGWLALNVGTLWLNAHRDRDRGEVLFGAAVDVPDSAGRMGVAALIVAVILSSVAGVGSGLCAAICAVLAVLYSHPRRPLKAHPVLGPVTNVIGYGVLSPLAGYLIVASPPTPRSLVMLAGLAILTLGATFAAQAFQRDEDRARGDRTLVATHGPVVTLTAARACLWVVFTLLIGLAVIGWLPRVLLLMLVGGWWVDRHLARWAREPDGGTERHARTFAWRSLIVGSLAIALATADHVVRDTLGAPVAGLGTAAGHPADRPRLPSTILRERDRLDRARTGRVYPPG